MLTRRTRSGYGWGGCWSVLVSVLALTAVVLVALVVETKGSPAQEASSKIEKLISSLKAAAPKPRGHREQEQIKAQKVPTIDAPRHYPKTLPLAKVKKLSDLSKMQDLLADAKQIAVKRVPDTPGHAKARDFLVAQLEKYGWTVEKDEFEAETPLGRKKFTNLIAGLPVLNANQKQHLVLAAHYDSKYFSDFEFVGATDSAVPCALLLDLARTLPGIIEESGQRGLPTALMGVKLVFFDGEEAFREWTETDSLYGSRHLAHVWAETPASPLLVGDERTRRIQQAVASRASSQGPDPQTMLEEINLLVLLDLIGDSKAEFYAMHQETAEVFRRLCTIEETLLTRLELASVSSSSGSEFRRFFNPSPRFNSRVEDDHIPFLNRGVKCLHLISLPFPRTWHTEQDTMENIDPRSVLHISRVLRQFVVEYVHL